EAETLAEAETPAGPGPEEEPTVAPAPGSGGAAGKRSARRVARLWGEVLGRDPASFGPHDDFFDVGGSSLTALRVGLRLAGQVSLRQIMQSSRLGELAELLDAAPPGPDAPGPAADLLVPLVVPRTSRATLVCLPYAGGNAVHFRPLANAVAALDPLLSVQAVELPGHTPGSTPEDLMRLDRVARLVADEIDRQVPGPVALWGHCVGSALALQVAGLLADRGHPVEHIFLAAKVLAPQADIRDTLARAQNLTFDDVREWLVQWAGSEDLDLGPEYRELLTRSFRADSLEANEYLLTLRTAPATSGLHVPATVVLARDDAVTAGCSHLWKDWSAAVREVSLVEIPEGGHYFTRTRPESAAQIVLGALRPAEAAGIRLAGETA
ncbi:MAG: hypothetical protein QG608_3221, partial [Actinomycetota bacterium]|nr:hypothetical protein [Actinomycetota bacterium]